jgi:hypothetical protein
MLQIVLFLFGPLLFGERKVLDNSGIGHGDSLLLTSARPNLSVVAYNPAPETTIPTPRSTSDCQLYRPDAVAPRRELRTLVRASLRHS